jgi:DNA-binding IscR family transcriptional regulator
MAYLKAHPEGAIVATLAEELGASVGLVERKLYSLRRQGLVTSNQIGTPPVTTWRCL